MVLKSFDGKNANLKKNIISLCISNDYSIAELSKELNASIPTITKIVTELIEEGFIADMGKQGTSGGRRPNLYGLNCSAGYIVGVEVGNQHLKIAITDFKGQVVDYKEGIQFHLVNTMASFESLVKTIVKHVESTGIGMKNVITCGITLSGRVSSQSGYSFTYFISEDRPLTEILSNLMGVHVSIENDSRAMTYGEYLGSQENLNEKNILFINVNWGLGMGMILDGKLNYGNSGYSGEIGHFPMLNNNVMCHCGKVGCLETGASGTAAHRIMLEKLKSGRQSSLSEKFAKTGDVTPEDIINAALDEDMLAIGVIEEIGTTLGRAIAGLINVFNTELVIIGGKMSAAKDYILLPVRSAVNKFSLSIVSRDTRIRLSTLGSKAGPLGACLLSRSKFLGLI